MFHRMLARLRALWSARRKESELNDEIAFHLSEEAEERAAAGLSAEEAQWAAQRDFGNVTLVRETTEDVWRWGAVDRLLQDIRYGIRALRRSPGFAGIAIATLALGIGGVTAVFSVVQAVLLAPLPYDESGQLVRLYQGPPPPDEARGYLTGPHFKEIRDHAASFEDLAALYTYAETGLDLFEGGRPSGSESCG